MEATLAAAGPSRPASQQPASNRTLALGEGSVASVHSASTTAWYKPPPTRAASADAYTPPAGAAAAQQREQILTRGSGNCHA
jgi:hypothetical protein